MESALCERLATAVLHHQMGHDQRLAARDIGD